MTDRLVNIHLGETLFGLKKSEYPLLVKKQKHLMHLKTLYNLYESVIEYINNCHEMSWSKINIEKINQDILQFKAEYTYNHEFLFKNILFVYLCLSCKNLHSSLKNWLAFTTLKKKIEDFHESLPLVEMMAHPSIQKRHWEHLEKITSYTFNIEDDFSLKSVIQAPLLTYKDEIEVGKLKKKIQ